MSAEIQVTNGPGKGTSAPMRGAFLRVGGDTGCDLVLAGEAPHALVVRSRGDQRVVYNRGAEPLRVGRKKVPTDASAAWRAGQTLRLASGTELQWANKRALAGEPISAPTQAATEVLPQADDSEPDPAAPAAPGPSRLRTVALTLAIVGVGLFVFDEGGSLSGSAGRMRAVVQELEYLQDRRLQLIRCSIQLGRTAELRGEMASACEHYTQARELLRGNASGSGYRSEWAQVERAARDYVNDRLTHCDSGKRRSLIRRRRKA